MTTPEKAKGSQWERDIVKYLQECGFTYAERRGLAGQQYDKGDITGLGPDIVIEAKNAKSIDLAKFLTEAELERDNARAKYGIACIKRRQKSTSQAYVVMSLEAFVELWKEREGLE